MAMGRYISYSAIVLTLLAIVYLLMALSFMVSTEIPAQAYLVMLVYPIALVAPLLYVGYRLEFLSTERPGFFGATWRAVFRMRLAVCARVLMWLFFAFWILLTLGSTLYLTMLTGSFRLDLIPGYLAMSQATAGIFLAATVLYAIVFFIFRQRPRSS